MQSFSVKTRRDTDPHGKVRVYFVCHPEDFDKYFNKISSDVFRSHDCAIYYTDNMTAPLDTESIDLDLGRMSLFLVPVTFRLINEENRAMTVDIAYAKEKNIPILPFMMEEGLEEIYSLDKNFGERQYLSPFSTDVTEISYYEKLKKFLDAILISDEMAQRVRAAFDAYVFLSYRKKDRKYANELMRIIHAIPGCRDIAIWYDEFLTPGESWRENIRHAMEMVQEKSNLFTLLVTPNLLEEYLDGDGNLKKNFVMETEYPEAKRMGMDILAAEMEDTNRDILREKYDGIPDPVRLGDEDFADVLLSVISRIAISENDADPEHNFLIGLAYLDGIDVEVDVERGIRLIASAAEAGLPEAMRKLYNMYSNGDRVKINYAEAAKWAERLADHYMRVNGEEDQETLISLNNLAMAYEKMGSYHRSLDILKRIFEIHLRLFGEEDVNTLTFMSNLGLAYNNVNDFSSALEYSRRAYEIKCRVLGEEHYNTLLSLNNLAYAYTDAGDYVMAVELYEKAYGISVRALGEEDSFTVTVLSNLSIALGKVGQKRKALLYARTVYDIRVRVLGEEHPDTIAAANALALTYGDMGEYDRALEFYQKGYEQARVALGEEHPITVTLLGNIAYAYLNLKKYREALEYAERAYEIKVRIFGEEHPGVIGTASIIASCYGRMRKNKKEIEINERSVEIARKIFGNDHPSTAFYIRNLAAAYSRVGKRKLAFKLTEEVYYIRLRSLGEAHEETKEALLELCSSALITFNLKTFLWTFKKYINS